MPSAASFDEAPTPWSFSDDRTKVRLDFSSAVRDPRVSVLSFSVAILACPAALVKRSSALRLFPESRSIFFVTDILWTCSGMESPHILVRY